MQHISSPPGVPPHSLRFAREGREGSGDRTFGAIGATAAVLLVAVLVGVAACVIDLALPSIRASGLGFVTTSTWDPVHSVFGGLAFVWGTLLTSIVALSLAVPIGLGVAVFQTDLGPRRLRRHVGTLVELLAAIPSVVYGLWAALVLAPVLRTSIEPGLEATLGFLPLFRGPKLGVGVLCASLVLAIMLLPTVASVTREVLRSVPSELREGGLALGATRWDVVRHIVFPHAKGGIFGAILLAFGRAIGETMAVAMVIGSRAEIATSLFAPGYTMASVIANEFPVATSELHVAALAEVGLLLFIVTLAFNAAARALIARRFKQPKKEEAR